MIIGVACSLQPQRVVVWYWKQLESGYSAADGFPTFIYFSEDREIYGLPAHEYPGLVKVSDPQMATLFMSVSSV